MAFPELTWQTDQRAVVGDVVFRTLPPNFFARGLSKDPYDYLMFKPQALVDRYVALIEQVRPRNIFELGIMEGGSTVFLSELARPKRLIAIELETRERPELDEYLARKDVGDSVRVYTDVDQADRPRLAEIAREALEGEELDLVFDDASHLYEPTRASFNELFPRLRPGGVYAIEDWCWAHPPLDSEHSVGLWPDETPLTRLIFELALAIPSVPGMISNLRVDRQLIEVTRGRAELDPAGFDISQCSNERGKAMLREVPE